MDKEIALKNLIDLDRIFRNHNTEYWISCGTLLGLYRDNDFIDHDTDTDVCVNIDSLTKNLLNEILGNGFVITNKYGRYEDGYEIALNRDGVKTDLFFFYKKDNYWYHSVYSNFTPTDSLKHDYVFEPFGLKETEFLGHKFITPDDIEKVLIQQYGDDWRTPNKKWSWYLSPKNIKNTKIRVLHSDSLSDFDQIK